MNCTVCQSIFYQGLDKMQICRPIRLKIGLSELTKNHRQCAAINCENKHNIAEYMYIK